MIKRKIATLTVGVDEKSNPSLILNKAEREKLQKPWNHTRGHVAGQENQLPNVEKETGAGLGKNDFHSDHRCGQQIFLHEIQFGRRL